MATELVLGSTSVNCSSSLSSSLVTKVNELRPWDGETGKPTKALQGAIAVSLGLRHAHCSGLDGQRRYSFRVAKLVAG